MTSDSSQIDRGPLYWFLFHMLTKLRSYAKLYRRKLTVSCVLLALVALLLRAFIQPLFLLLRQHSFLIVLMIAGLWIIRRVWRSESNPARVLGALVLVLLCGVLVVWGRNIHNYLALYLRYSTLQIVELQELPTTDFERIQPLNSVFSLAHEVMTESETPMLPDFVRVGDDYRWTMAVEPAYLISRLFGGVREIFNVPGTSPSPTFSLERRVAVQFETGERLLLSHNSHIATIRTFGLWRYLNYEPADVTYITDDSGQWVQVVSLIRWSGFLFPRPEFGGVQIIRQEPSSLISFLKLFLLGAGEWIPAGEVSRHRFLQGQNILPYQVSRYMGHSFRFQGGFWAPFPGYHRGDVRIPILPQDVNDQPFAAFFRIPGVGGGKLYHYAALEPYDPEKQGLNTSVFIPADGETKVFVYRHYARSGSLTGVSAIAAKVMESRKNYDWSRNQPVEHRPFIKHIDGKERFFWLTTVVTFKEREDKSRFIAGSVPDVVLTDASYNASLWVDPLKPSEWLDQIRREMTPLWNAG